MFVLGACVSSASAAVPQWYTGTTSTNGTLLTGTEPLAMAATENSKSFEYGKAGYTGVHMVIQSFFGSPLVAEATGMECVSCSIENRPAGAGGLGNGKLKLTNVTLYSPPGCTIFSETGQAGTLITKQLQWEPTEGGQVLFRPASGGSTVIQFKVENCGGASGSYNLTGYISSQPSGAALLGVPFKTHDLTLGGGMKAGTSNAWFEGRVRNSLPSGKYWYAK
jgi:hypothetical protein